MEYNFSQHVTKEDYVNFLMNHLKMNIMKPFNLTLFVVGLGYLLLAPIVTGTGDFTFTIIGFALIAVMVLSVFFARRNAAKRYDKNKDMFDMTYKATDEAFSFVVGNQTVDKQWMDFYSAAETEDYLYIFASKDSGSVLIKRDIPSDAIDFVRSKLVAHVNPKRLKVFTTETTTE
jgi:hypothetical protein